MSLKLHLFHSHLDFFPSDLEAVSDEHGERFHQDIKDMESRYQGRFYAAMMGNQAYYRCLVRDADCDYKRKTTCMSCRPTNVLVYSLRTFNELWQCRFAYFMCKKSMSKTFLQLGTPSTNFSLKKLHISVIFSRITTRTSLCILQSLKVVNLHLIYNKNVNMNLNNQPKNIFSYFLLHFPTLYRISET